MNEQNKGVHVGFTPDEQLSMWGINKIFLSRDIEIEISSEKDL